ncbi:hypothetical protein COY95_02110 [Candidatus Woesearchaeota archaeon CG_4_10_14_0_8_um_filter_47_5]|nr:MAG: hypothetical protein COY95_02110 [Candidatus Woesearchaeota archaeon CG_4_10_14_0_8_um_filter_47_5]
MTDGTLVERVKEALRGAGQGNAGEGSVPAQLVQELLKVYSAQGEVVEAQQNVMLYIRGLIHDALADLMIVNSSLELLQGWIETRTHDPELTEIGVIGTTAVWRIDPLLGLVSAVCQGEMQELELNPTYASGFLGQYQAEWQHAFTTRLRSRRLNAQDYSLQISVPEQYFCVNCNNNGLYHVVQNLIYNAVDAFAEARLPRGTISIGAREQEVSTQQEISHGTLPAGNYVVISVSDDGPGISHDILSKIFEPGVTTKKGMGGSGMGLYMVRRMMIHHQGYVHVVTQATQEEGSKGGTTFELYLPLVTEFS